MKWHLLDITNVPGSVFHVKQTWRCCPRWPWNCGRFPHQGLYGFKSQPAVFLVKAVGVLNGKWRPKPLICARIALSLPNWSNPNPFQKRSDRWKSGLLETTQCRPCQDYYVAMEASLKLKEISDPMWRLAAGELNTYYCWSKTVHHCLFIWSSPSQPPTRGNVQEVAVRGLCSTIAEENVAKGDRWFSLTQGFTLSLPNLNGGANPIDCHLGKPSSGLDVDKPRNLAKPVNETVYRETSSLGFSNEDILFICQNLARLFWGVLRLSKCLVFLP